MPQLLTCSHRRGAAAIIAMMFLVIFGSLAAAMTIVSQGNLAIADSQIKVGRSLASAETGMNLIAQQMQIIASQTTTPHGEIDAQRASELWMGEGGQPGVREQLYNWIADHWSSLAVPQLTQRGITVGPVAIGPGAPQFTATLEPHPLPGAPDRYDDPFYQRQPYNNPDLFDAPISSSNPLDARWIRVVVTAHDGPSHRLMSRSISMDFRLDKKLRFAILSRSRVMIGSNVMVRGNIGSRFMDVHLQHGHPIQMASDFHGLNPDLDVQLEIFRNTLATNDMTGNNRLSLASPSEMEGISDPEQYDVNGDGYIDEWDFFLAHFDNNDDGRVSMVELQSGASDSIRAAQLMELIDTFGFESRPGFADGFIGEQDAYAKIRGQVMVRASLQDWEDGAAEGIYQDYFQGSIHSDYPSPPLSFGSAGSDAYEFTSQDFDVQTFRNMAHHDLMDQAVQQHGSHDPEDPTTPNMDISGSHREAVPFGAAHPYDYYDRPVFENMVFENVTIPKGTNALFKNCTFIGVTFIETNTDNVHPNYNYSGMQEANGMQKHPNRTVIVDGEEVADTKTISNNIRFDNCVFEGAIVSDAPQEYTHTRNKVAFTGNTQFRIDASTQLSESEKRLFKRSTMLMPHYSIEMGTFVSPYAASETLELSGTIVAGIVDMRGQIKVNGSIITTFEPQAGVGPVLGETSPTFNTTIGYFSFDDGDLEMDTLPGTGIGVIQIQYDPTLAMPDGITSPIELRPLIQTYHEGIAP